jgi:peptidoglycan/LPS O-acetylase OafA/YrhL
MLTIVLTRTATVAPPPLRRARRSRSHLAELDVVRPAASLMVIITHAMQMFASTGSIWYGAIVLESQASRHVFFFVSAMVLAYQAFWQPRWSPFRFWSRRGLTIVIPYAIWVVIYWAVGFAGLRGDTIPGNSGSIRLDLKSVGQQLITGPGHLYFVFVLMQFYLVFPLLLVLLNRGRRWPWAILGVALAVQLVVTVALHYGHWTWSPWYDLGSTRQLSSYVFYLVAGAITGAHLPAVRAWIWRHRWLLLAAGATVVGAVEVWYWFKVRNGQSTTGTSDPFSPEFIPLYLATVLLLWLAGAWWANRARDGGGWPSRLVRTTSDDSYGVYLSHIMFLDILATLGLGGLDSHVPWIATVVIAVLVAWTGASLLTVLLARTPLSRWLTGRARRPWRGGPPPVGWGSVAEPGRSIELSSGLPQWPHESAENSQSTAGPQTRDDTDVTARLTR